MFEVGCIEYNLGFCGFFFKIFLFLYRNYDDGSGVGGIVYGKFVLWCIILGLVEINCVVCIIFIFFIWGFIFIIVSRNM